MTNRNGKERKSHLRIAELHLEVDVQHNFDATLVIMPNDNYGSSQTLNNELVRKLLLDAARTLTTRKMIIDLSDVDHLGAAFLGSLTAVAQQLKREGRQLVICGDRLGICRAAQFDRLFPVLSTGREQFSLSNLPQLELT